MKSTTKTRTHVGTIVEPAPTTTEQYIAALRAVDAMRGTQRALARRMAVALYGQVLLKQACDA